jgi:replicative DNA helicase
MITQLPPQNIEIEQACLSCGLLNEQALLEIISKIEVDDFYLDRHRLLFECLKDIKVTDFPAIRNWFELKGLELTHAQFSEIFEGAASSASIDFYIKEVLKLSKARKIIVASQNAIDKIYNNYDPDDIKDELSGNLLNIDRNDDIKVYNSKEIFDKKTVTDFIMKPENFVKTGIADFDETFFGLYMSELVAISGRPSQGKSALAMNIASNQSKIEPVLYISMEMPKDYFSIRRIACEAMVNSFKIQHGYKLTDIEKDKIKDAIDRLAKDKFYLIDKAGMNKETIDSVVRRHKKKYGLSLLVVDYLQIMTSKSKEQRHVRIGEDTLTIKNIARDLNIPSIVVSSKSRGSENSKDLLSGFGESGKIEYDTDKAIFLDYDNWEDNVSQTEVQGKIVLAKNKYGPIGFAPITFYKAYSKFI